MIGTETKKTWMHFMLFFSPIVNNYDSAYIFLALYSMR